MSCSGSIFVFYACVCVPVYAYLCMCVCVCVCMCVITYKDNNAIIILMLHCSLHPIYFWQYNANILQ